MQRRAAPWRALAGARRPDHDGAPAPRSRRRPGHDGEPGGARRCARPPRAARGAASPRAWRASGSGHAAQHAVRGQEPVALGHVEPRVVEEDRGPRRGRAAPGPRPGSTRFGTTQRNGSATRTRTPGGPGSAGPWLAAAAQPGCGGAADRRWPAGRATSAVSAGWTTLPAAKIPAADVAPSAAQAGPPRARVDERGRPGGPARCPATKSPLNTMVSTATRALAAVGSTERATRSRWVASVEAGHRGRGPDRHPQADAGARRRTVRTVWECGRSVTSATVRTPASRRVSTAEYDTCSAPTTRARRPTGRCLAVHPLLELAGGEDAGRARPGDQAGRPRALPGPGGQDDRPGLRPRPGRSGPVTSARPGAPSPVTMERVRMSTPAADGPRPPSGGRRPAR